MKLTDVLTDANRADSYPVVITDDNFIITFYNGAAAVTFCGIENGRPLEQYAEIYNKRELKTSRYPSSALLRVGKKRLLCSFCPVITEFRREYVFTVAKRDGIDPGDSEYYITMKTTVLLKCMGDVSGENMTAGAKQTYARLYAKYEANMRLITAIAGSAAYAALNVREFFGDVLSYYCALKYGGENKRRYDIVSDAEIIRLSNVLCVIIVSVFDICEKLSQNGYCGISFSEDKDEDLTRVSFEFKPKPKLCSAMERLGDAEDAVYRVLGRGAEDISLIKSLAVRINGELSVSYDGSLETITVTTPTESGSVLKANGCDLMSAARIAVERLN